MHKHTSQEPLDLNQNPGKELLPYERMIPMHSLCANLSLFFTSAKCTLTGNYVYGAVSNVPPSAKETNERAS